MRDPMWLLHLVESHARHEGHACLIYDAPADRRSTVGAYFAEGLAIGQRCVYILSGGALIEAVDTLDEAGIDVPAEAQIGALRIMRAQQTYLRGSTFDADAMLSLVRGEVARAVDEGFSGLRVAGEMEWSIGTVEARDLIAYERRLADVFAEGRLNGLCMYERPRFPRSLIAAVADAHPVIVGSGGNEDLVERGA
jgi:hypothetical protein